MINFIVITTFLTCFLANYFAHKLQVISPYFVLLPELMSGVALIVVLGRLVAGGRVNLDYRYFIFIVLLLLTMAVGAVAQNVPAGAVVSGMRDYLPYLSFLLLGASYPFSDRQIKQQVIFLSALLVVQVPLAVYQRFVSFADRMHTGDVVTGTVVTSSALSIIMVSGVAVLTVLFLKRRLSLLKLLLATGFLLIPTTLNETKGTTIMLPIAMLAPLFCMRAEERPFRRLLPLLVVFCGAGVVFISVYNTLIQNREPGTSLQGFWLEGGLEDYVYKGSLEGDQRVGRVDSLQLAVRGISRSPLTAAFGLGAGNVSPAQIPGFEGDYASYYDLYKVSFTQLSMLLWNLGFVGAFTFVFLYYAMFRDAFMLAKSGGPQASLGQVWVPLTMIATMCLVYKPILTMNEITYPFMFYAGVVGRHAALLRRERTRRRSGRARSPAHVPADWSSASALARQ